MSDVSSCEEHPLPLSVARRINAVCNRFELAWQAGPRPRLEDFLGELAEPERSALLRELLVLDIDYRRRADAEGQRKVVNSLANANRAISPYMIGYAQRIEKIVAERAAAAAQQ
jgi:hypothetical protein